MGASEQTSVPSWLGGLFAVPPTPMLPGGAIDLEGVDSLVDYYLGQGARGLVAVSVVGEGAQLDTEERAAVIRRFVRRAAQRAPVVAGVLAAHTEAAVREAYEAIRNGASALLIAPPAGQAPLVLEHYVAIAGATRTPIVLLDDAAASSLPVATIECLAARVPEICGIQLDHEPTTGKLVKLRRALGNRIRIFGASGGASCLEELEHDIDGFFTGCAYARPLVAAMEAYQRGESMAAVAAYETILPVIAHERRAGRLLISMRKEILRRLKVIRHAAVRHPTAALTDEALARIPAPGFLQAPLSSLETANILIVDSSRLSGLLLQRVLARSNPTVAVAAGRARALDTLKTGAFDLVILDLTVEPAQGIEMIREMRFILDRAPLVLVVGGPAIRESLLAAGCAIDGTIAKPYDEGEVLAALQIALRQGSRKTSPDEVAYER